ncbi:MAG: efflux transporter outer membrane subunit [Rikenellaceae bacterium]
MKKIFIYISAIIIIAGCSPKLSSPEVEIARKYSYSTVENEKPIVENENWWEIFGDATLNNLIEKALENNQDALIALSKIEQAYLQYGVDRAAYLPQFSFDLSAENEYIRPLDNQPEYGIKPTVSWQISLFGALKNATKAAKSDILAQEYNYNGIMLALTGEVAKSYFSLIQYRQSVEISKVTYKNRLKSMAIIDSLVNYGMSTSLELKQAKGLTSTAAAAIHQYERAAAKEQSALSILLGESPRFIATDIDYSGGYDSLPEYIPSGLPINLLERRSDIMQDYALLQAAAAKVGIARAARFPSISITASGGLISTVLKNLVSSNPYALGWTGLFSVATPIFQFGKLKKSELIAVESYEQAILEYRNTIFTAISDVENALISISTLREQNKMYKELVESNKDIQFMTSKLYLEGMVDYLNLLDAERTLYSSQLEYSSLLAQKYSAYVDMFLALGGGY